MKWDDNVEFYQSMLFLKLFTFILYLNTLSIISKVYKTISIVKVKPNANSLKPSVQQAFSESRVS